MAFGSVQLMPGVNVERTPMLLRAGYSASSLIRWRDGLAQKYGGWQKFYPFNVPGVPRDLHAWLDLNDVTHLAVLTTGTNSQLGVITNGAYADRTPQTLTTNPVPNISTTSGSPVVSIVDPNIANVTTNDAVFFAVPVSIGGLILDGLYPITEITGVNSYQITANANATTTVTNPTATNATTAVSNSTLHFSATPTWIKAGMVAFDITAPTAITPGTTVASVTGTTVVLSAPVTGPGVGNGDNIVFASVPVFTTSSGSNEVNVEFIAHGIVAGSSAKVVFPLATTVGGVTIQGSYGVIGVPDANDFTISANATASGNVTAAMNGGDAQLVYYITIAPLATGSGFGLGGYGDGGFGTGAGSSGQQTGIEITATDWTSDNWGEILLACPQGQALYYYDPTGGFGTASPISSGPPFNNGMFLSTTEQILIAYGSSSHQAIGYQLDPLLVQWSDVSNFFQWDPEAPGSQAGNFPIPFGSKIMAGGAVANQNLLWTDLDLWAMNYIGPPDVFGFNQIGAGMGAVSSHAFQKLRGGVYWMAPTNFCSYTANGAEVIPCPVWDAVFQNLNTAFLQNVRAMPNTPFNEVGWEFPSLNSTNGENDSYVKMNITEPGAPWDIGIAVPAMARSAWIDQNVAGMPIGATSSGTIFQHETSPDANGQPLVASFTTGLFYLAEGEDYVTVDQVIPDFKYGTFAAAPLAQVQITFNLYNFPEDTPTVYGPFIVTANTQYIFQRMRGRLMSITVQSQDIGSFWRLGSIKYRYAASGRR